MYGFLLKAIINITKNVKYYIIILEKKYFINFNVL